MPTVTTEIHSEKAARYLVQLCKHFAHKVPAEWDDSTGNVDFKPGTCRMQVDGNVLRIECEDEEQKAIDRMKLIVTDHVSRFAWKEKPQVVWSDDGETG